MRPLSLSCSTGIPCEGQLFSCNMTWELSGQCLQDESLEALMCGIDASLVMVCHCRAMSRSEED